MSNNNYTQMISDITWCFNEKQYVSIQLKHIGGVLTQLHSLKQKSNVFWFDA